MKTLGLLGGMSQESAQSYYRELNRGINRKQGGVHSAELVTVSVDFAAVGCFQSERGLGGSEIFGLVPPGDVWLIGHY